MEFNGAISACVLETPARVLRVHGWVLQGFDEAEVGCGAFKTKTVIPNLQRNDVTARFKDESVPKPGWRCEVFAPDGLKAGDVITAQFLKGGEPIGSLRKTVASEESGQEFDDRYTERLRALNAEIAKANAPVEGGMFFISNPSFGPDQAPSLIYAQKRENFRRFARGCKRALEVGFNAGHSGLMCLSLNPDMRFTAVDIGWHSYTPVAAKFMKAEFGDRFAYFEGDSREMLPRLAAGSPKPTFDFIHIDGGHTAEICRADIKNALEMADLGCTMVIDDLRDPLLLAVANEFVDQGRLKPFPGLDEALTSGHGAFMVKGASATRARSSRRR